MGDGGCLRAGRGPTIASDLTLYMRSALFAAALVASVPAGGAHFGCDTETQYAVASTAGNATNATRYECFECAACGTGQECIRAGAAAGCTDCPVGRYNADGNPVRGCADCPEDSTSEHGAVGCAAMMCGALCKKIIGGAGATLLALLLVSLYTVARKCLRADGEFHRVNSTDSSIEVEGRRPSKRRFRDIAELRKSVSNGEQLYEMEVADFEVLMGELGVAASDRPALRKEFAQQVEQRRQGVATAACSPALNSLARQASVQKLLPSAKEFMPALQLDESCPVDIEPELSPSQQKDFDDGFDREKENFMREDSAQDLQVEHLDEGGDFDDFLEETQQLTARERQLEREISHTLELDEAEEQVAALVLSKSQPLLEPEPDPEPRKDVLRVLRAPTDPKPLTNDGYTTCLDRPFVQKELRWAKQHGKKIVVVFEQEERRVGHFDFGRATSKYQGTEWEAILNIDAIPYRRDEGEAEVMVQKIIDKTSSEHAPVPINASMNAPGSWDFFLSHAQATGGDQMQNMQQRLKSQGKEVWYDNAMQDRSTAAMEEGVKCSRCVVLFLTADVTAAPSAETQPQGALGALARVAKFEQATMRHPSASLRSLGDAKGRGLPRSRTVG